MRFNWTKLIPKPDAVSGAVPCPRSSHGVSLVREASRLIVYGGELQARTPLPGEDACWAVDHVNGDHPVWRRIFHSDQPHPPDRIAHAQAVYQDKYIYVFGGRAGITMGEKAMNDMWSLNCSGEPGSETWNKVSYSEEGDPPPEARSFHRMICVGDKLYVFGGCGASGRLADFHVFCLSTLKWKALGCSGLKGRGGPNLVPLCGGSKIGVVAGFAGAETADGQVFDVSKSEWEGSVFSLVESMRPRSVCISGAFPSLEKVVIFGGEVDPSERGHEGAGGFANDIVLLDEKRGSFVKNIAASTEEGSWPETRGWSDADTIDLGDGSGQLFLFGGLSGDDTTPRRLGDLWKLELEASS